MNRKLIIIGLTAIAGMSLCLSLDGCDQRPPSSLKSRHVLPPPPPSTNRIECFVRDRKSDGVWSAVAPTVFSAKSHAFQRCRHLNSRPESCYFDRCQPA